MVLLVTVLTWNTNGIMVGAWMLWLTYALERGRYCGVDMDALVNRCSCNTNAMMVWAWMLWSMGTQAIIHRVWAWMLLESCTLGNGLIWVGAWVLWSTCALATPTL